MKIIIAGAGKVGTQLARLLTGEGHDVTVLDKSAEKINRVSNGIDAICVEGSATNPDALIEAGAATADVIIAATAMDEVNMVCGITASKLGTKNVIARVRDATYLEHKTFLQDTLGLSFIINPEYECAKEISRILRLPGAARVESFAKSDAEIVEFKVREGCPIDGIQLWEMHKTCRAKVLVGAVERNDEAIIPKGSFTIKAGDRLSIIGPSRELRRFFAAVGEYRKPAKDAIIMGGGRIAVYLAGLLADEGINVSIIEQDRAVCDSLCDLAPEAKIVHGDATRGDVLQEEGIAGTDAFIAVTGDDGDNIITSMYAASVGVDKVVTKVNRDNYADILEDSPLESLVSPRDIIAQQIARYVRALDNSQGSSMESLYRLADGKAEAIEFKVSDKAACIGTPLRDLKFRNNVIAAAIIRGRKTLIPDGFTEIVAGDRLIVITTAGWLKELDGIQEDAEA